MNRPCTGNGLLIAGGIVTLIGLGLVLTRTFGVPREWTTLLIGLAAGGRPLAAGVAAGRPLLIRSGR